MVIQPVSKSRVIMLPRGESTYGYGSKLHKEPIRYQHRWLPGKPGDEVYLSNPSWPQVERKSALKP
jgi:hypothetical protein